MKNKNHLNDLNEIKEMIGHFRTINESVMFAEDYNGEYDNMVAEEPNPEVDPEQAMPQEPDEMGAEGATALQNAPQEEPTEEDGLREMGSEVDQIREIALKGMIKLCHNTEDPAYDALKKIFQFCDKANEKKDVVEK